ncbi:MAG: protein kinase, partial [Planctomycetota bacterium]
RGGMGAVFRGRQTGLNRAVAVKVLPPDQAEETNSRERFLREARAIALVSSPHIVQVFHAGTQDGWSYYVMELIDGADLSHRMKDGWRPTVNEARGLILQAARGLATAARHGIVHRDIKPGNLLLAKDGTLKIADFGLVRHRSEGNLTATGQVMGTTSYMSPEQGLGKLCDERSDLYSLGVVFYELLSGSLPFVGDNPAAVIYQHIHEEAPSLRARAPLVDADTESVVLQLMAKDPDARYASADALVSDLEAIESGRHPATMKIVRASRQRVKYVIAAAIAVGISSVAVWFAGRDAAPPTTPSALASPTVTSATSAAIRTRMPVTKDLRGEFLDLELIKGVSLRLRRAPSGEAWIGSPAKEAGRAADETMRRVPFPVGVWLSDREITQQEWTSIMGKVPTQEFPRDDLPVSGVDRKQIGVFCERLAKRFPGLEVRLPSEAEWEYVARAGSEDAFVGAKDAASIAGWHAGNAGNRPHPAKQFPPNLWGF